MGFRIVRMADLDWEMRPHEPDEPARFVGEYSERAGMTRSRANLWRYQPGAKGRRHRHATQEETFVVAAGTLSMYLGDPPERHDVPTGSLLHVEAGTPLQAVNHGDVDLVVFAYGAPPEDEHAEILEPAV